jgi:uncharacterized RDD family membrane protein YckC
VIRICPKCGALLLEDTPKCSFCDVPLSDEISTDEPVAVGVSAAAEGEEPEWRREVVRRLEEYRARRRRNGADDSQSGLPFYEEHLADEDTAERPRQRFLPRARRTERVEICIQPELNFSRAADDRARPQTALVPVATLAERRMAGLLDGIFLVLTYAGFLALFRSLGGQIQFQKMDALVYFAAFYLLYAQYFFLFTALAGSTPGMQLRGLTVVRLDGHLPDTRQLLWRSFGYMLSGATLMMGYLWALWDEDRFTWQDRISQTYITAAPPLAEREAYEVPAGRPRYAHK